MPWIVSTNQSFGTPNYLEPKGTSVPWLTPGTKPEAGAMQFLVKYGALFQMKDPAAELTLEETVGPDELGLTHVSFTQQEGAASVVGTRMTVHFDAKGRIAFVTGLYIPNLYGFNTGAAVSPATALASAQTDMTSRFPAGTLGNPVATAAPQLVIDALAGSPILAYTVDVSYLLAATTTAPDPQSEAANLTTTLHYEVDANTGAVLSALDPHETYASTTGSSHGVLYYSRGVAADTKRFPVAGLFFSFLPPYYMRALGTSSVTPRWAGTPQRKVSWSWSRSSWDTTKPDPGEEVDAYFFLGQVDAWWRTRHQRVSYDNQDEAIRITAHATTFSSGKPCSDNAFWNGMPKGQGGFTICQSATWIPVSAGLDVLAHEFQHAVTQYTIKLGGGPQPGALNESTSDVFGSFVEHNYAPDAVNNVEIGEIILPPSGLRSLKDPKSTGQPDNMQGYDPNGDVHTNCGIPSNAWYLATIGGTNSTSQISVNNPIGWDGAETLYVSMITGKGTPPITDFKSYAEALVGTAKTQFGPDPTGPLSAVACAWYAVSVLDAKELETNWNVTCVPQEAGTEAGVDASLDAGGGLDASSGIDAGNGGIDAGDGGIDAGDGGVDGPVAATCVGVPDGTYCGDQLGAGNNHEYQCLGGLLFDYGPCDPLECVDGQGCVAPDAGQPPPGPCAGRADGTYCGSDIGAPNPADEYDCESGLTFDLGSCSPLTCVGGKCR